MCMQEIPCESTQTHWTLNWSIWIENWVHISIYGEQIKLTQVSNYSFQVLVSSMDESNSCFLVLVLFVLIILRTIVDKE